MDEGISRTDVPAFSRGELTSELRGTCPVWILEIIDAVVIARGGQNANVYRATVVNEVLADWAEKKRHEAMLVHRVAGLNPTASERAVHEVRVGDLPQRDRA